MRIGRFGPSEPTRVIFVRHSHVHNPKGLIYGRLPRIRLSRDGREAMERTACFLADVPLAAIYTSPLLRARQSAAILGKHHPDVPIHRCSWLVEVRTSWEGELNKAYKETEGFSYYDPPKGPGDETILDVFTRMDRTLRMLLTKHAGRTSVCVSHGDPIKILRVAYSGKALTPDNVRAPDPGQASMVTFDFWHPDALPVISAVDLGLLQRLVRGESSGGGRQEAPRR